MRLRETAVRVSVVLSLLLVVLACAACGAAESPRESDTLLIANALLVDGTGAPPRPGAVRVRGDRIEAVGTLEPLPGERVVDLEGRVLAPGFVDTHSHADRVILEQGDALGAVSQGITTVIVGNDGGSPFPLVEYFEALDRQPAAINVGSYSGHGTIRAEVMGDDFRRPATEEEVARMGELLRADLDAGALGLATGLEYDPGIYSGRAEVLELARIAAAAGGRYISHMRSEDRYFWDAVEELIEIGREASIPVQISHTKLAMLGLWGQADRLIARLETAREAGVDVTADIYPYPYWQSTLTVLFPDRDFEDVAEARMVLEQIVPPDGVLVTEFAPNPDYAGMRLDEIAAMRGEEPAVALLALIAQAEAMREAGGVEDVESMIGTSMSEEDIERIMSWEHTNFCTDGELMGAHPRGFGSFPRILGRYVRDRGVMPLEEAVRKASSLGAEHVGLADRGRLREGWFADLVAFDPATIIDRATTENPHAVSEGITHVWVNGVLVWDGAGVTGQRPGRVLRRAGS